MNYMVAYRNEFGVRTTYFDSTNKTLNFKEYWLMLYNLLLKSILLTNLKITP